MHFLGKTLLDFGLLHSVFQGQSDLLLQVFLDFLLGKTTRLFRYDLNQIPYDYTVELTNRFKGLDLIDRVPEKLGVEVHNTVQEAEIKNIPKKKKCNR